MPSIRVAQIFIVESLSEGRTGRQLYEDISVRAAFHGRNVRVTFSTCTSRDDLIERLRAIAKEVVPGTTPILHIEAHGDELGVELADKSYLTWGELGPLFTDINVVSGINLFLLVAACFGGYSAASIRLNKPAVFGLVLAPPKEIRGNALYQAFHAFYAVALEKLDVGEGLKALRNTSGGSTFYFSTAERMFRLGFRYFFANAWSDKVLKQRAARVAAILRRRGKPVSVAEVKKGLKRRGPKYFQYCYDTYFAVANYPINAERFKACLAEFRKN